MFTVNSEGEPENAVTIGQEAREKVNDVGEFVLPYDVICTKGRSIAGSTL